MTVQENIRLNTWGKLAYHDPRADLVALRAIELESANWPLDPRVRALRTGKQKMYREWREAALFCHGLSAAVLGCPVHFAPVESSDYDFIARWQSGDTLSFAPVQMKELVPTALNPAAEISDLLAKLQKYPSSDDLVIAVHVNRRVQLTIDAITVPALRVAEIWLFGAGSSDQSKWYLIGDLLRQRNHYEFTYPT